jgi:hypothetical protein
MMEAVYFSETLATTDERTRLQNPEYQHDKNVTETVGKAI